jgi:hypothetical protein
MHNTPEIKMKYIFPKNETREKVPKYCPFPNILQGVILLNKSSTSAWLEIILLANINKYFRYSTLYFFFEIRKPFESKNLYGRVERRWISIFETMGIHLRLARPIEDGPANRRPPRSFKRRANTQDRPTFSVGDVFWVACRNCGTKSASCTKTVFFFKRNYAHFFYKIYLVLRRSLFLYRGSMGFKKKKNRGSGGQPLEDPYCPLRSLCRLPKGKTKMTQKGQKQKRP